MITRVKFMGIPVRDQKAQLAFYTEKLGFEVLTDQPLGKQRWIELKIPRAETHVVLFTPEGHEDRVGGFVNASLACDDVQKTYEELKARGVEFSEEPSDRPYGVDAALRDPSGNSIRLVQST